MSKGEGQVRLMGSEAQHFQQAPSRLYELGSGNDSRASATRNITVRSISKLIQQEACDLDTNTALIFCASLLYVIAARILPTPGLTSTKSRGIDHEKSIYQYDQSLQIQDLHSPQVPSFDTPIPPNINPRPLTKDQVHRQYKRNPTLI
jgi:hypothetical protein